MKRMFLILAVVVLCLTLFSCKDETSDYSKDIYDVSNESSLNESASSEISKDESSNVSDISDVSDIFDFSDVDDESSNNESSNNENNVNSSDAIVSINVPMQDFGFSLPEEVETKVYNAITNGIWIEGICKCIGDFEICIYSEGKLVFSGDYVYYAGVINDHENNRRLVLDNSVCEILNPHLKSYLPNLKSGEGTVLFYSRDMHGEKHVLSFSKEEADKIYNAIATAKWQDGTCDCVGNFDVTVIGESGNEFHGYYMMDEGAINDYTNQRRMVFDEETWVWLNDIVSKSFIILE